MRTSICIITGPISPSAFIPLYNLFSIFKSQKQKIEFFQSGDFMDCSFFENVTSHWTPYISSKKMFLRVVTYLSLQLRISIKLIRYYNHFDTVILIFASENFSILILLLKILRKRVIFFYVGSTSRNYAISNPKISNLFKFLQNFNCKFADKIILYSPNLINEWDFGNYNDKILFAHEHFLNTETFTVTIPYSDRPPSIGYIGRLSWEKGIQNFVQALPIILSHRKDLKVLIGGDGEMKESIKMFLGEEKLLDCVNIPGWISHKDLPEYLNQLQLLVIPSFTEGLPNIMLEALSCGTSVLATPVGAIPDILQEGKTGYIMRDNSPECIAENIIRALNDKDREKITENGRGFVQENFTFERTVKQWKNLINTL